MKAINSLDIDKLTFVGTALFIEFPSTTIFTDVDGRVVVREWGDCSDDLKNDYYYYYYIDKFKLRDFLEGITTHYELIKSVDSFLLVQDISLVVTFDELPISYIPLPEFVITPDDIVEKERIYSALDLYLSQQVNSQIFEKAEEINKGIISFYVKNKEQKVSKGAIESKLFGELILAVNTCFNHTDYVGSIAASFCGMFSQQDLFDNDKQLDVLDNISNLLNSIENTEKFYYNYSKKKNNSNAYKKMFELINKNNIDITLSIHDKNKINYKNCYLSLNKVKKAVRLIEEIEHDKNTNEEIFVRGVFNSCGIKNRNFSFADQYSNKVYSGIINKCIENIREINFQDSYDIKVKLRKTKKKSFDLVEIEKV